MNGVDGFILWLSALLWDQSYYPSLSAEQAFHI